MCSYFFAISTGVFHEQISDVVVSLGELKKDFISEWLKFFSIQTKVNTFIDIIYRFPSMKVYSICIGAVLQKNFNHGLAVYKNVTKKW